MRTYQELARVEQAALARGPRTRGLRGSGLGAGEGLGAVLYAYAAAGVGVAILAGIGVGIATKNARTGAMVGGGLLAAEGLFAASVYGYSQYQTYAHQTQMDAQWAASQQRIAALPLATPVAPSTPVPGGPGNGTCGDPLTFGYPQCFTCPPGSTKVVGYGNGSSRVVRCAPPGWVA